MRVSWPALRNIEGNYSAGGWADPLILAGLVADHVWVSDSPSVAELLERLTERDVVIEALRGQLAVA